MRINSLHYQTARKKTYVSLTQINHLVKTKGQKQPVKKYMFNCWTMTLGLESTVFIILLRKWKNFKVELLCFIFLYMFTIFIEILGQTSSSLCYCYCCFKGIFCGISSYWLCYFGLSVVKCQLFMQNFFYFKLTIKHFYIHHLRFVCPLPF